MNVKRCSGILSKCLILGAAGLVCTIAATSQQRAIDTSRSKITVHVSKSGILSAAGHNHVVAAPISGGGVDTGAHQVELKVNAKALTVQDPGGSDKDRAEIQKTMLGPQVLDTEQYPEIAFRSTGAESAGAGAWKVQGSLTLHGQSHPVAVDVREANGNYTGSASFKQTEFGIKPVKVAGGTIRVKDEVRIEFEIYTAP